MASAELDLISPDLVFMGMEAANATELLERLGEKLGEKGLIKGSWHEAILERERNYPTGLQCQAVAVAIPHTDPQNIERPYIAVVRPASPVEFMPMTGGDPVQAELIVNLGIVHAEGQVKILQLLMLTFMDDDAVADIMAQDTPEALYDALMRQLREKERGL